MILVYQSLFTGLVFAQAPVSGQDPAGGSIDQRLDRVERILQGQGLMDMLEQLGQLQQEISMLRGDIESQAYALEQLTRRQRDLYTDIDQRLQRLERGGVSAETVPAFDGDGTMADASEPPLQTLSGLPGIDNTTNTSRPSSSALQVEVVQGPVPGGAGTDVTPNEEIEEVSAGTDDITDSTATAQAETATPTAGLPQQGPADPAQLQAEYQQAFNLLRQGLYDQAIRSFQQFLALHPDDRYSDNAQYWLAEAYYVKREFQQALAEYNNVITRFPQSQKINDARLKIGFTLYELGEMDSARRQLQELIQDQPGSTVARLADERLKMMNTATQNTQPAPGTPQ